MTMLAASGLSERSFVWLLRQENALRDWLRRRAVRFAVRRAYRAFKQDHELWANSLFDEYFLTRWMASQTFDCWQPTGPGRAEELARAWAGQLRPDAEAAKARIASVAPVAAAFLKHLDAELRRYPVV